MITIGLVYDTAEEYAHLPKLSSDQYDEFEPNSTIDAMAKTIRYLGHTPVLLGGPLTLLENKPSVDLIWNIGEGFGTRNREAWAPVLSELYSIPCLGSDALSLSLSLDKARTKAFAKQLGIPTANWFIASYSKQDIPKPSLFPIFIKPRYEGTAKGINKSSLVFNQDELENEVQRQWNAYKQDCLLEQHLSGAEFTIALSGTPLRSLSALERAVDAKTKIGIHALENKGVEIHDYELSHSLSSDVEKQLERWSLALCDELDILDFARLDFKCDEKGNPNFLEINPLPTFATDNTYAIIAELENKSYTEFLASILDEAIRRVLGDKDLNT